MPKTRRSLNRKQKGGAKEIQATIVDQASTQILRILIPPGASIIADQSVLSFMTGDLKPTARTGGAETPTEPTEGGGFWNGVKRAFTGQSFLVNEFTNSGTTTGEITLSPSIPCAISEIIIQEGEEWKVAPGSVLAATSNVKISGSLNIFENFRASFVTKTAVYTTIGLKEGEKGPGRAWISGFGGIETRTITPSQTPFLINNGIFLAMPAKYWNDYVDVGTPSGFLSSFMTNIGFVLKIMDRGKNPNPPPTFPIYMQTINIHNFKNMIQSIAAVEANKVAQRSSSEPLFRFE